MEPAPCTVKVQDRMNRPQFVDLYANGSYTATVWGTARANYTLDGYQPGNRARYMVTVYDHKVPIAFLHVDRITRIPLP